MEHKYQIHSVVSCNYIVTVSEHTIIFASQQKCELGSFHRALLNAASKLTAWTYNYQGATFFFFFG